MAEGNESKFRNEIKYVVSAAQLKMIENRIARLMPIDSHAGSAGRYSVRSLYFDDPVNRCYYENENGTDPREKFRIRIYNHSTDRIMLECKRKERGMTMKTACPLTETQTRLLMQGEVPGNINDLPPLLRKLTIRMLTQGMRPVVIVEYERVPYVYRMGNVRVTMDMNISSSSAVQRFLDEKIPKRPVMPVGRHLLEVKYDSLLPDFIRSSLQLDSLAQTAYSKYYICRKYTR